MASGSFVGLPLATLTSLRDKYISCLEAIAVAGMSYSIAGRSFTRANLTEVRNTIEELTYAFIQLNHSFTEFYCLDELYHRESRWNLS